MSDLPKITTTHIRSCRIIIDRHTLTRLVTEYALQRAGFAPCATKATPSFKDVTKGSPGYKVGTECIIDLTEDQTALPRAEEG